MTREFNQKQRYDSRPSYRGSSSNNRYGAEQPSGPTRPRLNRTTVDRAWENGAPHRHADYKPRHTNEAGTNQTKHGPSSQRNWRKTQPSEHPSHNHAFQERGDNQRSSQHYDAHTQSRRSDYSPNGYQGTRSRSPKPNHSFADRPPYRDQRGNGNEENTYRARNDHPNFSPRPQDGNRGRHNQEPGRQEGHRNDAYSYRTPTNRVHDGMEDRRDQRSRPFNQREAPYHDNRFEGRQRTHFNESRRPSYPTTPGRQRENRNYRQSEQFEGDYEQFNHVPAQQPRDDKRREGDQPQAQPKGMGKQLEVERHVTPLPDGRVLKGPRPVQRRNAQFWTDISQDTEKLVNPVQIPEATVENVADEQAQTGALPAKHSAVATRTTSPRAKAAQRAAHAARRGKTDRPVSSGPKPSQRGFKWPASPSQS